MSKKVLVIDNDTDCRDVIQEALAYFGFDVRTDNGGTDVIKLVNDYAPDILLIDYILDGVNGGEWCVRIKKDPANSALPIIMISAYSKVLNSLGDYGCDCFISKPFDLDHLVNKLHELTCFVKN